MHFPTDYDPLREEGYSLLISFHGLGECGDATVNNGDGTYSLNMQILNKVAGAGVPKMIRDGVWETSSPMIVLAPQLPAGAQKKRKKRKNKAVTTKKKRTGDGSGPLNAHMRGGG
ncbi:hypothetical protein HCH_01173 [Hahella chejuensis KCTC 2396]|uniref:Uncharacterized protein n=1 Tax=Hahella chejuensis (strain KCTC 2396) TaxID=349521 RepID=Q2SMS5_HAHCH|nr:hypothetical protein [Hahella chejuensis]ABC28049.1 hypothetical protein HCH_01173 [Hahella chejuensis KCTC 2396]